MKKETLINALINGDNARPRSKQTAIGVSQLGGCRRSVWHQLRGDKGANTTLRLPAILGTAIHAQIESVILNEYADRADDQKPLIEYRIEANDGLPPATIDFFDPVEKEVVDWKTITLKNKDYFLSDQKRWQVQTYAYLLVKAGFDVATVTLVGIPRDGTERDIIVHSEPYDENVALQAFAWLRDIETRQEAPAPEYDATTFCQKYCEFFGTLCSGRGKDFSGDAITDPVATTAAKDYVAINEQIKTLELQKKSAQAALEGVNGVTIDGIKVSWSEIAGRSTPDLDAIKFLIPEVPMKQGAPSVRLSVK